MPILSGFINDLIKLHLHGSIACYWSQYIPSRYLMHFVIPPCITLYFLLQHSYIFFGTEAEDYTIWRIKRLFFPVFECQFLRKIWYSRKNIFHNVASSSTNPTPIGLQFFLYFGFEELLISTSWAHLYPSTDFGNMES